MSLHLLRPFSNWRDGRVKTVQEAEAFVNAVREAGYKRFYTWIRRRVAREADLAGGSVYFVKRNTLFRMPFIEIECEEGFYSIAMEPRIVRVEPLYVGFLRGWRYLDGSDAPADVAATPTAEPEAARIAAEKRFEEAILT